MIYETGQVLERHGNTAIVLCRSSQACARCAAGKGCGGALWSRLLGDRLHRVSALTRVPGIGPGDTVLLGLHESALVKAAAFLYGLPLAFLLVASVLAHTLGKSGEVWTVLWAAVGFGGGLVTAGLISRRAERDSGYRPVIVRRLAAADMRAGVERNTRIAP